MAREKVKTPAVPISNVDQANAALMELASLKRNIQGIKDRANAQMDEIKDRAKKAEAPLDQRMKALGEGLLNYASYNRAELFHNKKSLELTHGVIGFRKSTSIKTAAKTTLEMVIGKLKELGFKEGIRNKESVNKDELLTWPDERLALVGARRHVEDVFWWEVKEEDLGEDAA